MVKLFSLKSLWELITGTSLATVIKSGAKAYSAPNGIVWGNVPNSLLGVPVTIGNKLQGFSRIDDPKWSNGKSFWVKDIYLTTIETDPGTPIDGDWPAYFYLEKPDGTRTKYNKEV